jgi:hypothetical protein
MDKELSKYGFVEQCEEKDGMLHVKITKGFDIKMRNTMEVLCKVIELSNNRYTKVHKFITEPNLFHLIMKHE